MELIDVLQAILDKAGNKDFTIDASVDREDGEVRGARISLYKIYKPTGEAKDATPLSDDKSAGKVNITETEMKKSSPAVSKSTAQEIKAKLKIMQKE